jgi:hypothetical protein
MEGDMNSIRFYPALFSRRCARLAAVLFIAVMTACTAAPQPTKASLEGTQTSVAAAIYATLTASVPTITPEPTLTPVPAVTRTSSPTPQPTIQALVQADHLNVRSGPGTEYPITGTLTKGDNEFVTGQYGNCAWLSITFTSGSAQASGWIKAGTDLATFTGDCTLVPFGLFRPLTGLVVYPAQIQNPDWLLGQGILTAYNAMKDDSVVVLSDMQGKPLRAIYVRGGERMSLYGIPDGMYKIFFTTGQSWDWSQALFTASAVMLKFNDPVSYTGGATRLGISIQPVSADTGTNIVSVQDFPVLKSD